MNPRRALTLAASAGFAITAVALLVRAQTQPTTSPAKVSPEARIVLDDVAKAYSSLLTLDLAGNVSLQFDGAGKSVKHASDFTASFAAPNQFRHELKDDVTIVSTGEKLTLYKVSSNEYIAADVAKGEKLGDATPPVLFALLAKQNPSLLAAISKDPTQPLLDDVTDVSLGADVQLDGQTYTALELTKPGIRISLLVDKASHLLRREQIDLRERLAGQIPELKTAMITIDYGRVEAGAPAKPDQFAYELPKDAKLASVDLPDTGDFNRQAMALTGKPAPDFKLKDLNGAEVSLSAMKGSVVVLDFWATWCGPCKESLPGYAHLASQYASNPNVKIFAVNLREPAVKVRTYLDSEGLTIPTLLDTGAEVGDRYGVEGIPLTFVIGKDGNVSKVITSATEEQLADAITQANR